MTIYWQRLYDFLGKQAGGNRVVLSVWVLWTLLPGMLSAQSPINGPMNVCQDLCYEYTWEGAVTPGGTSWQVQDPAGLPAGFTPSEDGLSIVVCFTVEGTYTIVFGTASLSVTVGTFTELPLRIISPENCEQTAGGNNCFEFCAGALVTIGIRNLRPNQIEWNFFGNGEIIAQNNQQVTIAFTDTPGGSFLSYFGFIGDNCVFEGGVCIVTVAPPEAAFTSTPAAIQDTVEVCMGQSVQFINQSTAGQIQWFIENEASGSGQSWSYTFDESGWFEVVQRVENTCSCADEKSIWVHVLPFSGAQIYCAASVCQGDTALYSTDGGCAPYDWQIEGDFVLVDGGGPDDDFIQVVWLSGAIGTVQLEHDCSSDCPIPSRETIAILGASSFIEGPAVVCVGQSYVYATQGFDGVLYQWSVSPGVIALGDSNGARFPVRISGGSLPRFIALEIEDCTRNCTARDTLWLETRPAFELSGPNRLCRGEEGVWSSLSMGNPVLSNWEVRDLAGVIVFQSPGSPSLNWTASAGTYIVQASPVSDVYCQSSLEILVQIPEAPMPLPDITGIQEVCTGTAYRYELSGTVLPNFLYEWEISNGSQSETRYGLTQLIHWEDVDNLGIRIHLLDPITSCLSSTPFFPVQTLNTLLGSGPFEACLFSESLITLQTETLPNLVQWSLNPATSGLILESDHEEIQIKWLETGPVEVLATFCGLTYTHTVDVQSGLAPSISGPTTACRGNPVTLSATAGYASYQWYGDGSPTCGNTPDCVTTARRILLISTDSLGCIHESRWQIRDIVEPSIRIFTEDFPAFCPGDSIFIQANLTDVPNAVFIWQVDGVPVGGNSPTLFATTFGNYQLIVQDTLTGCTFSSNVLVTCLYCEGDGTQQEDCSLSGGGGNVCDSSLGNIAASVAQIDFCTYQFEAGNPNLIPETVVWTFFDGNTPRVLTGPMQSYSFGQRGLQSIFVQGSIIGPLGDTLALCRELLTVNIEYELSIQSDITCANDTLFFQALDSLGAGQSVLSYEWNFGDPLSGAENERNGQSIGHLFSSSGTFTITLRAVTTAFCDIIVEKEISIPDLPDATFSIPTQICVDQVLVPQLTAPGLLHRWFFDDLIMPGVWQDERAMPRHRYEDPGVFVVRVELTDASGCVQTHAETIEVFAFDGLASIDRDPLGVLCAGDTVRLMGPDGPYEYVWSNAETTREIFITEGGQYSLTLRDTQGCLATVGPEELIFTDPIQASILGRIPGGASVSAPDTLFVCAGNVVELRVPGQTPDQSLLWSNGSAASVLLFDGTDFPLLDPGLYVFSVDVTDVNTSCSARSPDFYVRVYSVPAAPVLRTDQTPPFCSDTIHRLFVQSPLAGITYSWSNGAIGEEIFTDRAGVYSVTAINEEGCTSRSNELVIRATPDFSFMPRGCFQACESLLLCMPIPSGYELISWQRDGMALTLPADPRNIEVVESGQYTAIISDAFGCRAESDPLAIDIFDQDGAFNGLVFLDRDNNGVFNPPDSLLPDVSVYLLQGGVVLDSVLTDANGTYQFTMLPSGTYEIWVDSTQFEDGWIVLNPRESIELLACSAEQSVQPIVVIVCPEEVLTFNLFACPGDSIEVAGMFFSSDTSFVLEIMSGNCAILESYQLAFYPATDTGSVVLNSCLGNTLEWSGVLYTSDTSFFESVLTEQGCDSLVWVELRFEEEIMLSERLEFCPGDTIMWRHILISNDTSFQWFSMGMDMDCDTLWTIEAVMQSPWTILASTQAACPGQSDGRVIWEVDGLSAGDLVQGFFNNMAFNINLPFIDTEAGFHSLRIVDRFSCEQHITVFVDERPPISLEVPNITLSCEGEGTFQILLLSEQDSTLFFEWPDGSRDTSFTVNQAGNYTLLYGNACDSSLLEVRALPEPLEEEVFYYVPNAFTPNADQINDVFMPLFEAGVEILSYHFEVFDRWGNRMFETTDIELGWDGIFKEELADQAVFVWKLKALVRLCEQDLWIRDHGDVLLLKL